MATKVRSFAEIYDLFKAGVQSVNPLLTDFNDGSKLDTIGGELATAASEINQLLLDKFLKTFFATAHGPEITGGDDDLQTLAVDHFGSDFARPGATFAEGVVTFSRPTSAAGNVTIPLGTIVKTQPNSNGVAQRYATEAAVTLIGLSISATVNALVAGSDGNAEISDVNEIESTLTDSTVAVSNAAAFSGGAPAEDDATYRETIRRKIESLRGATIAAIEATALEVAGVETATGIERKVAVIEYDIATNAIKVGATFFRIPYATLYIADANGTANGALLDSVEEAIAPVKAAGVRIEVLAATALLLDWTATITLNPSGPNFAALSADPQMILDSMENYIAELPIGTSFIKATAEAAILAIWGPAGTNDLAVGGFVTSVPSGNVTVTAVQKLIADDMEID